MNTERTVLDLAQQLPDVDWEPQGFDRERSKRFPRRRPASAGR